jgi:hypothetical protein
LIQFYYHDRIGLRSSRSPSLALRQLARDWPGKNPAAGSAAPVPRCAQSADGFRAPSRLQIFRIWSSAIPLRPSSLRPGSLRMSLARRPAGPALGRPAGLLLTTNEDADVTVLDIGRHARTPGQICRPLIPIAPVLGPDEQKACWLTATSLCSGFIPRRLIRGDHAAIGRCGCGPT